MISHYNSLSLPALLGQGSCLQVLQPHRQSKDATDGNSSRRSDKWPHSVYIMKVEAIGFADGLDVGYERKAQSTMKARLFNLISRVLCGTRSSQLLSLTSFPHQARGPHSPRTLKSWARTRGQRKQASEEHSAPVGSTDGGCEVGNFCCCTGPKTTVDCFQASQCENLLSLTGGGSH